MYDYDYLGRGEPGTMTPGEVQAPPLGSPKGGTTAGVVAAVGLLVVLVSLAVFA